MPGLALATNAEAELALATGDIENGIALHFRGLQQMRAVHLPGLALPTGCEPWIVMGEAITLSALAWTGAQPEAGERLYQALWEKIVALATPAEEPQPFRLDLPVAGTALLALGIWVLRNPAAGIPVAEAATWPSVADAMSCNRLGVSLSWDRAVVAAEEQAPGALAKATESLSDALLTRSRHDVFRQWVATEATSR